jgi:predicted PurR-regulated permease PerM
MEKQHPYEEPFLLALLLLSLAALLWLFGQFLPALLFALLLAISSYSLYQRLQRQAKLSPNIAAGIMTALLFLLVILPITYLLAEGGRMGAELIAQSQHWLNTRPAGTLAALEHNIIVALPLTESLQTSLENSIKEQLPTLIEKTRTAGLWLASNLFSGIASFTGFMAIALFSLFFFYRDGQQFIRRIVTLSPLTNHLDYFLLNRFAHLSTVLTISVLGIALLQGMVFALLMFILDMPWLFLGLAYAVASFIPIVGGFLVWGSVTLYFMAFDAPELAITTAVYSSLLIGFGIDNLLRPVMIQKLNGFNLHGDGNSVLDHTWITLLSTFAGLLHFGIMGLVFGPMLAAMAITVFDVYEHKHRHQLDYS